MTGQILIGVIKKRLDDVEGADATTQSIEPELRAIHTDLASEPMAKLVFFPDVSAGLTIPEGSYEVELPEDYNYNVERVVLPGSNTSLLRVSSSAIKDYQNLNPGTASRYTVRGNKIMLDAPAGVGGVEVEVWYSSIPDDSLIGNNNYETILMKKYPMLLADEVCVSFLLMDPDLQGLADRYIARAADKRERFRQELETQSATGQFNFEAEEFEPVD